MAIETSDDVVNGTTTQVAAVGAADGAPGGHDLGIPVTDLVERLNVAFAADLVRRRERAAAELVRASRPVIGGGLGEVIAPAVGIGVGAVGAGGVDVDVAPVEGLRAVGGVLVGAVMGAAVWATILAVLVLMA